MRNIKLIIEYDGKSFNGWQKQPNKLNIQGEIEKAIGEITGEEIDLSDGSNIATITHRQNFQLDNNLSGHTIIITALDRLHNESKGVKIKL